MKMAIAVLLTALLCVTSLEAAAPRLLMIYGAYLQKPVLLSDGAEIFKIFTSTPNETDLDLKEQPFFELALFWGPVWNAYVNDGKPLHKVRPEDTDQKGRLYPAFGDKPAVITCGSMVKRIPSAGLLFLERSGVPTRLPVASGR
jgi:hypothetical protein